MQKLPSIASSCASESRDSDAAPAAIVYSSFPHHTDEGACEEVPVKLDAYEVVPAPAGGPACELPADSSEGKLDAFLAQAEEVRALMTLWNITRAGQKV